LWGKGAWSSTVRGIVGLGEDGARVGVIDGDRWEVFG
jgi:hypothetical protein